MSRTTGSGFSELVILDIRFAKSRILSAKFVHRTAFDAWRHIAQ
jgi:hypothetical protein